MSALVCFTMDNLGDAADLGRGVIHRPREAGQRPALEQGFPALLALYERHGIAITHFVEGWNGEAHPEELDRLLEGGHTLGMHGWQHENWLSLDPARARELAHRATETLEKGAGVRPRAFRAPGGRRSTFTAAILEELGYRVDASLPPPGEEARIAPLGAALWTVPYEWAHVDASHWLWEKRSCAEVEGYWKASLERAAETGSPVVFIWHPHIMGMEPARREVGDSILRFVREDARFEILSLEALVERFQAENRQLP